MSSALLPCADTSITIARRGLTKSLGGAADPLQLLTLGHRDRPIPAWCGCARLCHGR